MAAVLTPTKIRKILNEVISEITNAPEDYVVHPGKDFTRNRKLTLDTMLQMLVSMGGNTLAKELYNWFDYSKTTATVSAFVQQRDKILPSAIETLFHHFVERCDQTVCFNGYRIFAIDGSDLRLPANSKDPESYIKTHAEDDKGYNLVHLDAMFDLLRNAYVDASIQPKKSQSEHRAFVSMVDRSTISDPVLIIADRGYESFNNMAHCHEKGWAYLIRAKESYGIITKTVVPNSDEYDVPVTVSLTRCQTKETRMLFKKDPCRYRWMSPNATFDYLPHKSKELYEMSFRVVRFEIAPGIFETVYTNLSADCFPAEKLRELYRMRWGIETSFRELKYAVGLGSIHSKKKNSMLQEVFARLVLYNFSSLIMQLVKPLDPNCRINFPTALLLCRRYLRKLLKEANLLQMIAKQTTPSGLGENIRGIKSIFHV